MHDAAGITFHLLRPMWLLALVPVAAVMLLVLWRQSPQAQWGGVIAPHLLKNLIVQPGGSRGVRPVYLVGAGMALGIIALSGPTWRRELPPFVEDKAPLMIALAVGSSMGQTDVAPSRLERGKQKIRDLLTARAGARTGLIAYAGTAHLVMPLTDDRAVIEPFLAALAPGLMPTGGNNAIGAVTLAAQSLATEPVAGTILIVADDLGNADEAALRQAAGRNNLLMLSVTPSQSAEGGASSLRSNVVRVSVDASDIRSLERRIETRFQAAQGETFGAQWLDEGYWLLLPVALLSMLWFRRGTTVAWALALFVSCQAHPAKRAGRIVLVQGSVAHAGSAGTAGVRSRRVCGRGEAVRRPDVAGHRCVSGLRFPHGRAGVRACRHHRGTFRARQCASAEPCL